MRNTYDQCIIGAGIIGLSAAFRLVQAGQRVLVIDRKGMGEEASRGNAGALAFADVEPISAPGIMRQAPKWLVDPLGPLSVAPGYALRMLPWMYGFWRASRPARHAEATRAQAALMELAKSETGPLLQEAGLSKHLRHDGALYLYEGEKALRAVAPLWDLKARHGVEARAVAGAALAELQPGLGARYSHAMFVPHWLTVSDPYLLTQALGQAAIDRGAELRIGEVAAIRPGESEAVVTLSDGSDVRARTVVLAGGAWSHRLARGLGDRIPLEAERGYNTTLPPGAFDLRRQLVLPSDGYVITPLKTGIRVGGAAEFAGLDRAPNYRRSEILLQKSTRVLQGLKTEGGVQWMGCRPSLPDTLPVIGRSPRAASVIYAFGHGHLGLTQSAATARLVTELALDKRSTLDIRPYRPDRF